MLIEMKRTRTREGIGVSETVRWTVEQPMVEAGLNEARERPGAAKQRESFCPCQQKNGSTKRVDLFYANREVT